MHPYHYDTQTNPLVPPTSTDWRNFYTEYGLPYIHGIVFHNNWTPADDLAAMLYLWTTPSSNFPYPAPVIVTEANWSNDPTVHIDTGNYQFCSDAQGCEGNYLADLFTWLSHHGYAVSGAAATGAVPIRVAWYRGADRLQTQPPDILGLYTSGGERKRFTVRQCQDLHGQSTCNTDNTLVDTQHANAIMANYYNELRYHAVCY